jgi:phosphoadenosine phosphosulfate reductase
MCGLIDSPRFRPGDLDVWRWLELADRLYAQRYRAKLERMADEARATIAAFLADGPAYCSVSWGKDSVVVADLCRGLGLPYVWVKVQPIFSPECEAVAAAFLDGEDYQEIEVWCSKDSDGWHASGTLEAGFKQLGHMRRISGIRKDESQSRRLRGSHNTKNSCVPIAKWSTQDVFAYLSLKNLPIHPAYAMSNGGQFDRNHIRVASLGGERGTGFDRRHWEGLYYFERLHEIESRSA